MKAGIEVPAAGRRSQFASDSDAAERRLIQSNNDASGYLQRVAGRLIRTACCEQLAYTRVGNVDM